MLIGEKKQNIPTIWNSSSPEDINKAFRWACNETARKNK